MSEVRVRGEVLLVDASAHWREKMGDLLAMAGQQVTPAGSGVEALALLGEQAFDVAVIDLQLPGECGMTLVEKVRKAAPDMHVVLVTSMPDYESAVKALRLRVFDYLCKPVDLDRILKVVREAVDEARGEVLGAVTALAGHGVGQQGVQKAGMPSALRFPRRKPKGDKEDLARRDIESVLLGNSPIIQNLRKQLLSLAPHGITVLVQGETGTGKDLVARLLHAHSPRAARGEFCKVNCPSVPESLFESEMFGYEKGAFTGANQQRLGRFEMAHDGTLFLDEIALLPLSMQAKLLEVLEYKSFYRVGGHEKITVDTRLIAATNAPLEELANLGEFRQDLFFRLRVCMIELPPLRDRIEDLPVLLDSMLTACAEKYCLPRRTVSPELLAIMMGYPWPGNVRELGGLVAQYAVQNDATIIEKLQAESATARAEQGQDVLQSSEAQMIKAALVATGWNQREAAKMLRISYSALRRRIQKYNIGRPDGGASWMCAVL